MRSAAVALVAAALASAQESMSVVIDEGLSTTVYLPPWPTEGAEDTTVAVTISATVPTDEASSLVSSIEDEASSVVSEVTSAVESATSAVESEVSEEVSEATSAVDSITSSVASEASSVTSSLESEATDEASEVASEVDSITSEIGDATTLVPSATFTVTGTDTEVPTVVVTAAAGKVEQAAPAMLGFCIFGLFII